MKKVKIMLLSLTLLAVVGGALAFKAKTIVQYCTASAYWDNSKTPSYYCSFQDAVNHFTTTQCNANPVFSTSQGASGVQKICTTTPDAQNGCTDGFGTRSLCPAKTTLIAD